MVFNKSIQFSNSLRLAIIVDRASDGLSSLISRLSPQLPVYFVYFYWAMLVVSLRAVATFTRFPLTEMHPGAVIHIWLPYQSRVS